MKRTVQVILLLLLILALSATFSVVVLAQSSNNYELAWYVRGAGGGSSASTHYEMSCTQGQTLIGYQSSGSYELGAGYWYALFGGGRVFLPIVLK